MMTSYYEDNVMNQPKSTALLTYAKSRPKGKKGNSPRAKDKGAEACGALEVVGSGDQERVENKE